MKDNLKLIVMDSMKEVGEKVDNHLRKMNYHNESYVVPVVETKFNNGEGKVMIDGSIREKDVYILSDPGNHSITYKMYDYINHKSPDDHYQDVKRVIYASQNHYKNLSLVMPLLVYSRQHRRAGRESLDCANCLQELVNLDIKNIITFDVHDVDIQNAIPNSSFDSIYASKEIIHEFLKEDIDFDNLFVIAPDTGALGRNNMYANLFKCDMGFFRKKRNTSVIVDGKNPIESHKYVGADFSGKDVIVVDDMIASGGSILEVATEAKKMGAKRVYLIATFALFTSGIDVFNKAYENNLFDKVFTTNLTYFNPLYLNYEWLVQADCSFKIAGIIDRLNKGISISPLVNETKEIAEMIDKRKNLGNYKTRILKK